MGDNRDATAGAGGLEALRATAEGGDNLMPFVLDAVRAHVTEGEVMGALREIFGEYQDPAVF